MKGTGFSPYINPANSTRALAPEGFVCGCPRSSAVADRGDETWDSTTLRFLPVHREAGAAILLPARLVRLAAERLLLAVADHANPAGRHSRRYQRVLGRVGAPLA